jgi:hypothetical protein
MRKFTFWYKKEIQAPSLEKAIKIEKKTPHVLSSVEHIDETPQELHSCIGFQINTESDDWED